MQTPRFRRAAVLVTIGSLVPALGAPLLSRPAPPAPIEVPVGQIAIYEGSASVKQTLGASPSGGMELATSLGFVVYPGEGPEDRRLLVVRSVTPQAHGLAMPPFSHVGFFWAGASLDLKPQDESPATPQTLVLERYLPTDFLPVYSLPEGEEVVREEEVQILNATVKARVKTKAAKQGSTWTVTRTLASDARPNVAVDDSMSTVEAWLETYVLDAERRVLQESQRHVKATGVRDEQPLEFEIRSTLKLKQVKTAGDAERVAASALDHAASAILADFATRKHPRDIYQRIQELEVSPGAALLPGVHAAFLTRLSAYRMARDEEARGGAASRSGAPAPAPDFTLEDLQGKKVSLREAIKGKVALLTFWGYGCGPCRKEAPYLSKLQEKYGGAGFTVIAVNGYDEPKQMVQQFVDQLKLKQPILLMGRTVGQDLYRVSGYPSSFWIDHEGKIVHKEVGFTDSFFPGMEERVKRMLAAAKTQAVEAAGK